MHQDTSFKKLRKTVDEKVKTLNQDIENLQQQVQELQNKLLLQEDRHQEELSQRRILDCKICYGQPDCWHIMLCGHMVCESCAERLTPKSCPFCRASFSGYVKCYPFAG